MAEVRPAVEAVGVSKVYAGARHEVRALDQAAISIGEGEFFTLLGPSGCGKTTLLRLIAGFEQPTAGELFLYGEPLAGLPPFQRPVNTVFQSYALFPHLTVARNVAFGLEMQRLGRAAVAARVREMLELVKLADLGDRRPAQLSGGQQQRVALARALATRPKVLLLDEPLSALDLKLRKEMQVELKRLQLRTGITFVFVTHDQEEALTMSDRIAVMDGGRILQVGTPTQIYEQPADRFVAGFIGESNFLEASCIAVDGAGARFRLSGGAELAAAQHGGRAPGAAAILAVRPERVELAPASEGGIEATVRHVVYFGTDTHYHLALADGALLLVREQNNRGAGGRFASGDRVSARVPPEALRVLAPQ